jgi:hypothetical protein
VPPRAGYLYVRLHRTCMRKFPFAIKAAVVCAIPLLACSTDYTLERLQNAGTFLYIAASATLPVLLLGFAGTASRDQKANWHALLDLCALIG